MAKNSFLRLDISMSKTFLTKVRGMQAEAAAVLASMVEEEFVELLRTAPQYAGNYVANFQLLGGGAQSLPGEMYWEGGFDTKTVMSSGSLPAINVALENSAGWRGQFYRQSAKSWWGGDIKIINRLSYAEAVEEADASYLREGEATAHALAKTEDRIQARFSETVAYGSPEWASLANKRPI